MSSLEPQIIKKVIKCQMNHENQMLNPCRSVAHTHQVRTTLDFLHCTLVISGRPLALHVNTALCPTLNALPLLLTDTSITGGPVNQKMRAISH